MKNKSIIRNLSMTFMANAISMIVSIICTLAIPKLMGVTEYGYWQLYIFYISYAGLLHLGLCDGVYLSNGGKKYDSLCFNSLRCQLIILFIYTLVFCCIIFSISKGACSGSDITNVIGLTCIGAFIHVIRTYLLFVLQATNKLKEYSVVTIIDRVIFIASVLFLCLIKEISYENMIFADIFGRIVSLIVVICYTKKIVFGIPIFNELIFKELKDNISAGSKLLLAGIASNFIIGIARIAIQQKWDIDVFGKVSLALSVVNMILSFISVASIVFFPILNRVNDDYRQEVFIHADILLSMTTYFVLIFSGVGNRIIEFWLPQYKESAFFLILVLPVCVFESETSMLLNTYIKVYRKEKALMIVNFGIMMLSAILSYITINLFSDIHVAIIVIDILVMIRVIMLKMVLKTCINQMSFYKSILREMVLFIIYIMSYMYLQVMVASVVYLVCYVVFIAINKKQIKEAIGFIGLKK